MTLRLSFYARSLTLIMVLNDLALRATCLSVQGNEAGYFDNLVNVRARAGRHKLKRSVNSNLEKEGQSLVTDDIVELVSQALQQADLSVVTSTCYNDIIQTLMTFKSIPVPILKLLDAQGFAPVKGIFLGNAFNLGNYHECVRIQVPLPSKSSYRGMWCGAKVNELFYEHTVLTYHGYCLPDSCSDAEFDNIVKSVYAIYDTVMQQKIALDHKLISDLVNLTIDYFVNNKMDNISLIADDVSEVAEFDASPFLKNYQNSSVLAVSCHRPLVLGTDPWAISVICLLSLLAFVTLIGTLYDCFSYQDAIVEFANSLVENENAMEIPNKTQYYNSLSLSLKCLMAFSAYTNFPKLFDTTRREGTLNCIHGIRFISMSWIIVGHVSAHSLRFMNNAAVALEATDDFTFQALSNASISVDTFFVLSGLLLSYLWSKETAKKEGRNIKSLMHWVIYYVHRFIRLTPPYMIVIGVSASLTKYLSDGPFWRQGGYEPQNCRYWWRNILYIQNLFDDNEMCFKSSWYLANDMQFYVLAPLFLVITYYSPAAGIVGGLVISSAGAIARGVVSGMNNMIPLEGIGRNKFAGDSFNVLYAKPWMRIGPYVIGLIVGYYLFKTLQNKTTLKINKILNLTIWLFAAGLAMAVVYGMFSVLDQGESLPAWANGLYSGPARTIWAVAVGWVCFACCTGHGGIVDSILSWRVWIPLSRLTYSAYLTHNIVIDFYFTNRSQPIKYDGHMSIIFIYFGVMISTYLVSLVFSLMLEAPIMALEKLLLPIGRSEVQPQIDVETHNAGK